MSTDWRVPWTRFTDELLDALRRTQKKWSLDVQPATVGRLGQVAPCSRFLAILCHGNQAGLAFEDDGRTGVCHHVLAEQLSHFFRTVPPDVVLVLACQGAAAAEAIHGAGVPLTVGVNRGHALYWHEAVELAATFFGALGSGHNVDDAVAQAMTVTPRGDSGPAPEFRCFGTHRTPARLPEGSVSAVARLDDWIAYPATEVFVGRKTTVADLLNAVSTPGVVHLVGPPGSGKTELARVLLDRSRLARWPHGGSAFVALDDVTTPEGVLAALALARPPSVQPVQGMTPDALGAVLGSGERLIVLDNADDVLDADRACEALRAVLNSALKSRPEFRARIVVTSTRALPWPLARSKVIPLSVLESDDETRSLLEGVVRGSFVARSGRVDERWGRVKEHLEYENLIRALGRHPLTIVWAGNALRADTPLVEVSHAVEQNVQGVSALLDELRQRMERARPRVGRLWWLISELPGGLPGDTALLEDEQQDLDVLRQYSALEGGLWSWRVVEPVRQYLRRCRGACVVDVSEQVRRSRLHAAVADALIGRLERIVSSLRSDRGAAARLEFDALRPTIGFLLGRTSSVEWPILSGRKGHLAALAGEAANYDALPELAWQWTLGAADDGCFENDRTRVLLVHATAAALRYDWPVAREAAELAQRGAAERHETVLQGRALRQLGDLHVYESKGHLELAEQIYQQALALFECAADDAGIAQTLLSLGVLAQRQCQSDEAARHYQSARAMCRRLGDRLGEGRALRGLGEIALRAGHHHEALRRLTDALIALNLVGARLDEAAVALELGEVYIGMQDVPGSKPYFEAALRTYVGLGERLGEAGVRLQWGDVSVYERDFGAARAAYEQAQQLFEAVGHAHGQAIVQQRLGELALRCRQFDEALRYAREALQQATALGDDIIAAAARLLEARAHHGGGDEGRARYAALEAYARAHRAGVVQSERAALALLAELVQPSHPGVSRTIRRVLRESPAGAVAIDLEHITRTLDQAAVSPDKSRRRQPVAAARGGVGKGRRAVTRRKR